MLTNEKHNGIYNFEIGLQQERNESCIQIQTQAMFWFDQWNPDLSTGVGEQAVLIE
jgi:hypothetical protein